MTQKPSPKLIAAIVVPTTVVFLLLLCCCCSCCSAGSKSKQKNLDDIESTPVKAKTAKTKKTTSTKALKNIKNNKPVTTSLLTSKLGEATPPKTTPISKPATRSGTSTVTNRSSLPVTHSNSTSRYRPIENARDSLDLSDRPQYWSTRRPPTPPQAFNSQSSLDVISHRTQDIPELRSLRRVTSPPSFPPPTQRLPPSSVIIADHTQTDGSDEVHDLPVSPYNGSNLGMHDEGPSRKATPRFTVPISRPQTAAAKSTTSLLNTSTLLRHVSGSSQYNNDTGTTNPFPMTTLSRNGTRSFSPKIRASRTIDIRNNTSVASSSSPKAKQSKIIEELLPPPRQLILNDEGLTPAQLARNLPRRGFTPKVLPTVEIGSAS